MARVLSLSDDRSHAEFVALILQRKGGFDVLGSPVPLDLGRIQAFQPQVTVLTLARHTGSLGRAIREFSTDVHGHRALMLVQEQPILFGKPPIIAGIGLHAFELPPTTLHTAFVEFPRDIDRLIRCVRDVA